MYNLAIKYYTNKEYKKLLYFLKIINTADNKFNIIYVV